MEWDRARWDKTQGKMVWTVMGYKTIEWDRTQDGTGLGRTEKHEASPPTPGKKDTGHTPHNPHPR